MIDCRLKRNRNLARCKRGNNPKRLKCWKKVGTIEPRWEVTKVKGRFEIYHEPSGGLLKTSRKELLKSGFKEKQLKEIEKKGTTYFKVTKC